MERFENYEKGFNKKYYIEVCTTIWGCVPVDVKWATNTNIYLEYIKQDLES